MQEEDSLTARKRTRQGEGPRPAENDQTTPDTQPTSSHQQKVAQAKPRIVAECSSSSGSDKESRWTRIRRWCVRWEVARKLLHTSIGFVTLHEWSRGTTSALKISIGLGKALVVITAADLLRFRWPKFARLYQRCLGFLMRPSERHAWNGVIFYLLGVITSLLTLPLDISVLSILILSWVDTAASVIGRRYGTEGTRLPSPPFARRKSVAGFVGAFGVGSVTALGFWWRWAGQGRLSRGERYSWRPLEAAPLLPRDYRDPSTLHQYPPIHALLLLLKRPTPNANLPISTLSLACGLVAAIAESFDCFGCDDNLLLPILSGWGIWGIMHSFSQ